MLLDGIGDELALGDGELTIGTIPVDLNAQELCGRPQISQFEVLSSWMTESILAPSLQASVISSTNTGIRSLTSSLR